MNSVCRDFPLLPVCVFGPFRPASGEREDDFPSYFAGREGKKQNSAEFGRKMKPSYTLASYTYLEWDPNHLRQLAAPASRASD